MPIYFLLSSTSQEHLWVKVGDQVIWASNQEKLLGVTLDKKLKFDKHVINICKKASAKVTALGKVGKNRPHGEENTIDEFFYSVSVFILPSAVDVLLQGTQS